MGTPKEDAESLVSKLPNDCSPEEIKYHLYVLEKVRQGLDSADESEPIPQEEAERRLRRHTHWWPTQGAG